jgi:hypothetical protein
MRMLTLLQGANSVAASRPVVIWGARVARPRRAHPMAAAAAPSYITAFVTDVEGNLEYFQRCVDHSTVLEYADAARTRLRLRGDAQFVYGGDVCDKGASLCPFHASNGAHSSSPQATATHGVPARAMHSQRVLRTVFFERVGRRHVQSRSVSRRGVGCHYTGIGDIRLTQQLVALKRFHPPGLGFGRLLVRIGVGNTYKVCIFRELSVLFIKRTDMCEA